VVDTTGVAMGVKWAGSGSRGYIGARSILGNSFKSKKKSIYGG